MNRGSQRSLTQSVGPGASPGLRCELNKLCDRRAPSPAGRRVLIGWPTLAGFARVGFPTVFVVLLTAFLLVSTGCQGGKEQRVYAVYTGGDPARGVQAIEKYRCGACHLIPGIHNADGLVGPPLLYWSRRTYVGGEVPNNPENLEKWIMSPKSIEPGTAMPTLGLSEQEAKDVAAYLYTLH